MALIKVKVHPSAREERIERRGDILEIWVKEEPKKGRANRRVIEILRLMYRRVRLVRGARSRIKIFEVEG